MIKASVIIPTKNAGPEFSKVLDKVLSQKTPWEFEVIVIDSGSKDGTVDVVKKVGSTYPTGIKLFEIPPQEFGHGKTRNFGGSLAAGEFLVYITQDALPYDESWLNNLVRACSENERIAGAFGRHKAYSHASPLVQMELDHHFENLNKLNHPIFLEDSGRYLHDDGYKQALHFFSNNNSCLRRSVWEKYPFPEVNFAEDQAWAKSVIEAGYFKAYAHDAVVFHSHQYGPWETLRRSYDESRSFYEIFGYRLLCKMRSVLKRAVLGAISDSRYLHSLGSPWPRIFLFMYYFLFRFAKYLGYYLGSKVPGWTYLGRWISLDESVRNSPKEFYVVRQFLNLLNLNLLKRTRGPQIILYLKQRILRKISNSAQTYWRFGEAQNNHPLAFAASNDIELALGGKGDAQFNLKKAKDRTAYRGPLNIAWVMPIFGRGGGGHFNIFRCQKYLEEMFGIKSANFFYPALQTEGNQRLQEISWESKAYRYYAPDYPNSPVKLDWKEIEHYPIVMATACNTAYSLLSLKSCLLKGYFIQDYETDFYPAGAKRVMAEKTYDFGYFPICAGPWLPHKIGYVPGGKREREHIQYLLGVDTSHYFLERTAQSAARSGICFYVRYSTERRGFELVLPIIEGLLEKYPRIPVHTVGMPANELGFLPNVHHYGVVDIASLRRIYSSHKLYVTPSFTNYSLLPAEIMACGGRVLDFDLECNRMVYPHFSRDLYHLTALNPSAAIEKICELVNLPDVVTLSQNLPNWKEEYGKIGNSLLKQFGRT